MWCVESLKLFYDHHGANTEAATEMQVLPSLLTQTAFSLAHWFVTLFWFHFRMSPFVNLNFKLFWLKAQAFLWNCRYCILFYTHKQACKVMLTCVLVVWFWCEGLHLCIYIMNVFICWKQECFFIFFIFFCVRVYVFHSLTQFKLY